MLGGYSADQLYEMKVAGDEQQYEQIMSDALFKTYLLRVSTPCALPYVQFCPFSDYNYYSIFFADTIRFRNWFDENRCPVMTKIWRHDNEVS